MHYSHDNKRQKELIPCSKGEPLFHQLVDIALSTSWFFIISWITLKSLKALQLTGRRALAIFIKILSFLFQLRGIIILEQNLLPNGGENMEFLEDRDQMNAILWSIIITGMCVIPVEIYYLRNTSVSDTFLDWKITVTIVAGIVGAVVHYFYIHMVVPYNS